MGDHDGLLIREAPDDEAAAAVLQREAIGDVRTSTCRGYTAALMEQIVSKGHPA